jgi:hypothetical protein
VLASITAVVTDELAPATHAGPLWPVLSGLLRKDPDRRLDAAETERMLRGVSAAPAGVSPPAPRPRRSHGSLAAAVGSAALLVLAAGGTAVGLRVIRSSQDRPPASAVVAPPSAASTHPATASTHPATASAPPATASARPTTPASPHTTVRTSPARTSPPSNAAYVPNPEVRHGHGHSKSSKSHGDDNQD